MKQYIKLSKYAELNSMEYRTAHLHWKAGLIPGKQLSTGTILVEVEEEQVDMELNVATYARVSSSENKDNLHSQSERLISYANAKGYKTIKNVKEVGSGLNDNRKKLLNLLLDKNINVIIVEHKDRFSRFGTNYITSLLEQQGRKLEIINETNNDVDDLMQDFVSIITSFTARLYGRRRNKRKTEQLIKELKNND